MHATGQIYEFNDYGMVIKIIITRVNTHELCVRIIASSSLSYAVGENIVFSRAVFAESAVWKLIEENRARAELDMYDELVRLLAE